MPPEQDQDLQRLQHFLLPQPLCDGPQARRSVVCNLVQLPCNAVRHTIHLSATQLSDGNQQGIHGYHQRATDGRRGLCETKLLHHPRPAPPLSADEELVQRSDFCWQTRPNPLCEVVGKRSP